MAYLRDKIMELRFFNESRVLKEKNMFKVIDMCGNIHIAYGSFVDEYGNVQFILCDIDGVFYTTNTDIKDFYKLYDATMI